MSNDTPRLRRYRREDRDACLALFDSNMAPYFAPQERPGFAEFLDWSSGETRDASATDADADVKPGPYFVVEDGAGAVIGCGGIERHDGATDVAVLTWGMVRRDLHKRGLGRFLLIERLRRVAADPSYRSVRIDTSQHTQAFFASFGFVAGAIELDGWAPGIHRVGMTLDLAAVRATLPPIRRSTRARPREPAGNGRAHDASTLAGGAFVARKFNEWARGTGRRCVRGLF